MDVPYSGFLDDTSSSHVTKSPAKTSTVAKEDIKWNEDIFFKRQGVGEASESLFITPAESPITAKKESIIKKETLPKPIFDLDSSSFISDKANSSLGILSIENFSGLSDNSFQSMKFVKKKKKLEKKPRLDSGDQFSGFENANIEERLSACAMDILENFERNCEKENTDAGSNSSSDIEYDGTNIPELNMDYNVLSLNHSNKTSFSEYSSSNKTDESENIKSTAFSRQENDFLESGSSCSEIHRSKLSDFSQKESAENTRNSIFNSIQSLRNSLYEQILADTNVNSKGKKEKAPKTIKVCPFLDVSSFEIEPILQKSAETTVSSSIENTRCDQEHSIDFCPEQISARSSSFKSSVKYDSSNSEISSMSRQNKSSFNFPKLSLPKEGLENEVLSGSCLQISESKSELTDFNLGDNKDKNSGQFSKYMFSLPTENVSQCLNKLSDLSLESKVLLDNSSDLAAEGENWFSQLGLSESDFFSSEAVKEMLKKDKEIFEKEQLLPINKLSGMTNWSPPSQLEVTAPSWFADSNSSQLLDSDHHISIGTLFSARSEELGTLSSDKERERPYFGNTATTPPKTESSAEKVNGSSATSEDKNDKNIRVSSLSEFLDEMSLSDPLTFASKIVEKCIPNNKGESEKLNSNKANITDNKKYGSLPNIADVSDKIDIEMSDIEKSNTFIRSLDSNINRETYTNVENKSTMQEPDNTTLNYSLQSSSERGSIKTTKSDDISNCSLHPPQHSTTREFSRPASVCSSTCSNHIPMENTLSLQYGCLKYLNGGVEQNRNEMGNSLHAGLCSHACLHNMQPNLLPFGAYNPLQSVIQNALSGTLLLSGTSVSCNGIQAPSELYFPEKIALGDSQELILTIRNTTNIAYYRISCLSAYLNDSPLPDGMSGLNFSNTVPSNVGNATDIKLIIAPKYEGKFEVNLQIEAFVNSVGQTLNAAPNAILKTKIQYTVVRPCISILFKGKNSLNLGTIIAGSNFIEYVTIINNSEVAVPLRISLSNDTSENQIYFGLKEMDRQKHPSLGALRFLSPTVLLYRIPASKNKNLPSSLDIPIIFESINGNILASINAAIETPTLFEILGFLKISAAVGKAKLVLKDTDQNPLILRTSKGATCSHSVTVMNDGCLSVVYDINIDGDSDVLFVSPNSLKLEPMQCATISVTFTPQTYASVKGNLLAAAEPHGQVFILTEIIGHVKESYPNRHQSFNPPVHNTRPTRDSIDSLNESSRLLYCDKKYLAWGCKHIGRIELKTFTVKNMKEEPIQVKLFIKEKDNGFMIEFYVFSVYEDPLLDESNQNVMSYKLTLYAKDAKLLSVIFIPKAAIFYSAQLCIKSVSQNEKRTFLIPLSGYGGTANLKVLDLSYNEKDDYFMDIDVPDTTENISKNIILYNSGLRPAYVQLLVTSDNLIENLVSKQIDINPSKFVLLEGEKKKVAISVNDMQRKQILKTEFINILYGDEILRQRLKRVSNSSAYRKKYEHFTSYFDGEEKVAFDSTYKPSPKDENLFHTNLKKIKINVYFNGQNTSFSRTSFGPLSEIQANFTNMTLDSTILSSSSVSSNQIARTDRQIFTDRRLSMESHSPPVKDSAARNISRLSLPIPYCDNLITPSDIDDDSPLIDKFNNMKLDSWSVSPKDLVVDSDNKEKRILLRSYSESDMRFKIECAIDVITISPISGMLSAKGEIGLRLTLISQNYNKLLDDYHGNIKIWCDGEEKNISVTVMKDKKRRNTNASIPVLNDSIRSGFLDESDFLENTVVESSSRSLNIDNIFNFPKEVDMHIAKMGVLSEKILVVGNPTREEITWNISPSSIMFAEPSDDSVDNVHSAIEFKSTSGVIKPMATENIVIIFFPRNAARFQQFFKLNVNSKSGTSQSVNFRVHGKAEADLLCTVRYSDVAYNKRNSVAKKKAKSELFIENEVCKFPVTASGQRSSETISLKNISLRDFKICIVKPQPPFSINLSLSIIKSKKFYKIPVHFKPLKPGKYESEVKFICDNGNELKVILIGLCSP